MVLNSTVSTHLLVTTKLGYVFFFFFFLLCFVMGFMFLFLVTFFKLGPNCVTSQILKDLGLPHFSPLFI